MRCVISSNIADRILNAQNVESNASKAEVCLGGKLIPFSDISQNSISGKRTPHKVQYKKKQTIPKIQYTGMEVSTIFWEFYSLKGAFKLFFRPMNLMGERITLSNFL